jgi:uncharacterized protein (TIGR02271 family)
MNMNYEKIVALFDTAEHAEAASRNLQAADFPGSEISIIDNKTLSAGGRTVSEPGLWHRLFGRNIEQHEAVVYGRTVESGGTVLTLRVPESDVPRAMGILNAHKVVDIKSRAIEQGLVAPAAIAMAAGASSAASTVGTAISRDQVLRLAEEQLNVGKKMVVEGTTRVRRFVTARPVEAKISLHEEHATVVRRAISDPKFLQDIDWSDRTIEVTETDEQAVVSKSARIAEEVVLSKEGSDREEIIRDTVRRQQAEVERVSSSGKPVVKPAEKKAG